MRHRVALMVEKETHTTGRPCLRELAFCMNAHEIEHEHRGGLISCIQAGGFITDVTLKSCPKLPFPFFVGKPLMIARLSLIVLDETKKKLIVTVGETGLFCD